jgi:hypothetical protein
LSEAFPVFEPDDEEGAEEVAEEVAGVVTFGDKAFISGDLSVQFGVVANWVGLVGWY